MTTFCRRQTSLHLAICRTTSKTVALDRLSSPSFYSNDTGIPYIVNSTPFRSEAADCTLAPIIRKKVPMLEGN